MQINMIFHATPYEYFIQEMKAIMLFSAQKYKNSWA